MQTMQPTDPYRNLVAAIILRALRDIAEHYNPPNAIAFLQDESCQQLATDYLGIEFDDGNLQTAVDYLRTRRYKQ